MSIGRLILLAIGWATVPWLMLIWLLLTWRERDE